MLQNHSQSALVTNTEKWEVADKGPLGCSQPWLASCVRAGTSEPGTSGERQALLLEGPEGS